MIKKGPVPLEMECPWLQGHALRAHREARAFGEESYACCGGDCRASWTSFHVGHDMMTRTGCLPGHNKFSVRSFREGAERQDSVCVKAGLQGKFMGSSLRTTQRRQRSELQWLRVMERAQQRRVGILLRIAKKVHR